MEIKISNIGSWNKNGNGEYTGIGELESKTDSCRPKYSRASAGAAKHDGNTFIAVAAR